MRNLTQPNLSLLIYNKTEDMTKKILIGIFILIGINSCNDDDNVTQNFNGNYSGFFTVEYSNGTTHSNPVTVNFSELNTYHSSGNGNNNDFFPAGGNGTYEIKDSKITFSDTNIWLAHFDWNLILNGEYDYLINDNQLIISADKNNIGFYKYELEKE